MKKTIEENAWWLVTLLIFVAIFSYYHWYLPWHHLKEGYVVVESFNCPADHLIKAHLGSMIYHVPGDSYYNRTSASNGYCFDSVYHAVAQGFRAPLN